MLSLDNQVRMDGRWSMCVCVWKGSFILKGAESVGHSQLMCGRWRSELIQMNTRRQSVTLTWLLDVCYMCMLRVGINLKICLICTKEERGRTDGELNENLQNLCEKKTRFGLTLTLTRSKAPSHIANYS